MHPGRKRWPFATGTVRPPERISTTLATAHSRLGHSLPDMEIYLYPRADSGRIEILLHKKWPLPGRMQPDTFIFFLAGGPGYNFFRMGPDRKHGVLQKSRTLRQSAEEEITPPAGLAHSGPRRQKKRLVHEQWSRAGSGAIQKDVQTRRFRPLNRHQTTVATDVVWIAEELQLSFVIVGVVLQADDALLNGLTKAGADFEALNACAIRDHDVLLCRKPWPEIFSAKKMRFFREKPKVLSDTADTSRKGI